MSQEYYIRNTAITILLSSVICNYLPAQNISPQVSLFPKPITTKHTAKDNTDLFNTRSVFIENIGQYGETMQGYDQMGKILLGYEGLDMPVLFTSKGLIHLQRKAVKPIEKDKEQRQREGIREEEIYKEQKLAYNVITMEWIGANPNPEIITGDKQTVYHTYGLIQKKAFGFKKVTYKEIYPGIDIIYSFSDNKKEGFNYSILARPGSDLKKVKIRYGSNVSGIEKDKQGNLLIHSETDGVSESAPICFYSYNSIDSIKSFGIHDKKIDLISIITGREISFMFPKGYNHNRIVCIDPFVVPISGFTGAASNKAYDIDYDYNGNIFIRGGGDLNACQLAKFDMNGSLQWVFTGTLLFSSWHFGNNNGGWVVEKNTGNIYAGQGIQIGGGGFSIIRLNSSGLYDNFFTQPNVKFEENWKMLWVCNGGNPQIFVAGGSTNSGKNFGICNLPSQNLLTSNITGNSNLLSQDAADIIIDPTTNSIYSIYCTNYPPSTFFNNRIFKHNPPYNTTTIAWTSPSGYSTLQEPQNRPYIIVNNSNSVNSLAVDSAWLFYWDGKNLKAFNKSNGTDAGTSLTIPGNTALMQGGIVTDNCNNVFVGDINGTIKVYHFDGNSFNDAIAPDIGITGFEASSVYALAYDNRKKLIYACGEGFVGSIDVSSYCFSEMYAINIHINCTTASISTSLTPAPPAGTIITYNLYDRNTFIGSNTTGVFGPLPRSANYILRLTINPACDGLQLEKSFSLLTPTLTVTTTGATCTQDTGTISIVGSSGPLPYTFSIDGINFQTNNLFTGIRAGTYTVTIKDSNGCTAVKTVVVPLIGSNTVTLSAGAAFTICEGEGKIIEAVSNANTFAWAPATGLNNAAILDPLASPIITTKYIITATIGPCAKKDSLMVFVNRAPIADAGKDSTICIGKDIQLSGSGGLSYLWTPSTYLNNPAISNPTVIKPPIGTIKYFLKVTDTHACQSLIESSVSITIKPLPNIFAGNDTAVAINQPFRLLVIDLNKGEPLNCIWSPVYGLNNSTVVNPIAILDRI